MSLKSFNAARVAFVITVVFLSIYFLLSPEGDPHRKHADEFGDGRSSRGGDADEDAQAVITRRRRAEELALNETRADIEALLQQFEKAGIPGTTLQTDAEVEAFRQKMDCVTRQGRWRYDPSQRPITEHRQWPVFGACDREFEQRGAGDAWKVREAVKYVWTTPEQCQLPRLTMEEACDALSGLRFLVVGDLTQYTLHDLMLDRLRDAASQCYGEAYCGGHSLCPGNDVSVKFVRNDIISALSYNPAVKGDHTNATTLQMPWIYLAKHFNVFVLNRGHHYRDDRTFRAELISTMRYIRKRYPGCLIVYRATTPGHIDCDRADRPYPSPPSEVELDRLPFHWGDVHRQNLIAREIVHAVGGIYLDVESVMATRADGHIGGQDCLRWCIPGPADVWLDLLVFALTEVGAKQAPTSNVDD